MKVLVTGATGFLGNAIINELQDHEIYTLARKKAAITIDLKERVPIVPNVDLVIHAAGKAHTLALNKFNINEYYRVNVEGTINLLKGLQNSVIPKYFVFISSVAVYGKEEGTQIDEKFPLDAKSPYGLSKIKAEELITAWCEANNVLCTILRLPLVAGPNTPGNLGAMIEGIKKGYYFNIDNGLAKKSIVLAEDVAKIVVKASQIGGTYNLTDGNHPSFKELSVVISSQLCKRPPLSIPYAIVKVLALIGDVLGGIIPINSNKLNKLTSSLTFNDNKARELLKWRPSPVLKNFRIE